MERRRQLLIVLFWAAAAFAQQQEPAAPSETPQQESAKPLPGAADVESAAGRRNENVHVTPIDTGALKDLLVRVGNAVTIAEPAIDRANYAGEHGRPLGEPLFHKPAAVTAWHGALFESHQNSVFNARTFFQVGPVKPSHQNSYGGNIAGRLDDRSGLSLDLSQRKIRGMVNGNVLVPLPSERTPLATEPRLRAIVERYLAAYPNALPNRLDFDPRALNTNSPQVIDETRGAVSADRRFSQRYRATFQYAGQHQSVDAFQLVAGQNPDSDIGTQTGKLSLLREGVHSAWDSGFGFQRARSQVAPEPNSVGAYVRMGYLIEELGPTGEFPIDRTENTFRAGTQYAQLEGRHRFTFGAS